MVKVINDGFQVCIDCAVWLANGDATGLDYHYNEDEAASRLEEITNGERDAIAEIEGGQIVSGDSEKDESFSWSPCDCCGSDLGGSRTNFSILGG